MRNQAGSILAVTVLGLTLTGCTGTPNNTDACRDLLNIQAELDTLVNSTPSNREEVRELLPKIAELADDAKSIDADGDVKSAATSLGSVADEWHDASEAAAESGEPAVGASLAAEYVDADIGLRSACSQFLP